MYDTGGELDNNEAFGNAIGGIVAAGIVVGGETDQN